MHQLYRRITLPQSFLLVDAAVGKTEKVSILSELTLFLAMLE